MQKACEPLTTKCENSVTVVRTVCIFFEFNPVKNKKNKLSAVNGIHLYILICTERQSIKH